VITEKDLQEAIAECQGVKNPNAGTCLKLAAFLTIQREMFGKEDLPIRTGGGYSYAGPADADAISYYGDTDFARLIEGRNPDDIWPIMDELMSVLEAVNPRLYAAVLRKIKS